MSGFEIGLLVGLSAVLVVAVMVKWRLRNKPMSVAEKAEYLSKRRARMLPALAIIFLTQQASFFSQISGGEQVSAEGAKIVGSSRVDLQACKLEYSIVSPK